MKKIFLVLIAVVITLALSVIVFVVWVKVSTHHFSYYPVSREFLRPGELYSNDEKQEKQFISYEPFIFSFSKPRQFAVGDLVVFKDVGTQRVKVARIFEVLPDREYKVIVDGEMPSVSRTIIHRSIIARD